MWTCENLNPIQPRCQNRYIGASVHLFPQVVPDIGQKCVTPPVWRLPGLDLSMQEHEAAVMALGQGIGRWLGTIDQKLRIYMQFNISDCRIKMKPVLNIAGKVGICSRSIWKQHQLQLNILIRMNPNINPTGHQCIGASYCYLAYWLILDVYWLIVGGRSQIQKGQWSWQLTDLRFHPI